MSLVGAKAVLCSYVRPPRRYVALRRPGPGRYGIVTRGISYVPSARLSCGCRLSTRSGFSVDSGIWLCESLVERAAQTAPSLDNLIISHQHRSSLRLNARKSIRRQHRTNTGFRWEQPQLPALSNRASVAKQAIPHTSNYAVNVFLCRMIACVSYFTCHPRLERNSSV